MKRLFWLGVGIAVGAIVVRQVTRAAHSYSPTGLADSARNSAAGLWQSVQDFVADVREGMAAKEAEIQAAFEQGVSLGDLDAELYGDLEYGDLEYDDLEDGDVEDGDLEDGGVGYGGFDDEQDDYGTASRGNGAGVGR